MDIHDKLIEAALKAMDYSYAPYSDFNVGAALLGKSGKIYTGCNIENSSFSVTNCAERTALFKAVSEGETEFEAIAVMGGKHGAADDFCPPCGVCRQALFEFCSEDFKVILAKRNCEYKEYNLGDILPLVFEVEL